MSDGTSGQGGASGGGDLGGGAPEGSGTGAAVDVLLPFYGDPGLLREAVASVLAQRERAWRLVVVDDGHPDPATAPWLRGLAGQDERVEYHRNERQLGAGGNYRRCVELARAPLAVVMGADDVMLPGYLSRVRDLHARTAAAVVQPGVVVVDGAGDRVRPAADRVKGLLAPRGRRPLAVAGEELATGLLHGNWTYFPSLCWRTDVLRRHGFRPGWEVVQDLALLLDVAASGEPLVLDDEVVFAYRRHGGSDSAVKAVSGSRFDEERRLLDGAAADMAARGWARAARAARWRATSRLDAASLLPVAVRGRDLAAARRLLAHALG
ncbi:glycosyltransferase family 2 protein [Pseudokineococcus marinus]